jgi:PAS domain S-box-containing protein
MSDDPALFESVVEALPLEVLVHDESVVVLANAAARAALLAESPQDILGVSVTRFVHPDGLAAGNQRRSLLLEQGQCFGTVSVKLRTLTGETFYTQVMACRIAIGGERRALVAQASFGGTGLPQAGGFVSGSSAFHEGTPLAVAVVESLPLPIVLHDATTIVYVNEAATRAFRATSAEDLVSRPMCDVLHPDGREAGMERRRLLFEKGYAFSEVSAKTLACDGTVLYTIASGGAVTASDGSRMGFCSIHSIDSEPGRPTFVR